MTPNLGSYTTTRTYEYLLELEQRHNYAAKEKQAARDNRYSKDGPSGAAVGM